MFLQALQFKRYTDKNKTLVSTMLKHYTAHDTELQLPYCGFKS